MSKEVTNNIKNLERIKDMTNINNIKNHVEKSWEQCIFLKLDRNLDKPLLYFVDQLKEKQLAKGIELIHTFNKNFEEVQDLIPAGYTFLLSSKERCLLHQEITGPIQEKSDLPQFKTGTSFTEASCGTNAIDLALRLNREIILKPEFHFCKVFNKGSWVAIPLSTHLGTKGCLALGSTKKDLPKEMLGIIRLLARNVMKELYDYDSKPKIKTILNEQQVKILKLLAQGLTSQATALVMKVSENTIKYHRKRIFEKLESQSIAEAIAKAIHMGLSLEYTQF